MTQSLSVLEFFAGGGMARLGLEHASSQWRVVFANDNDAAKCAAYRANFGDEGLIEGAVQDLEPAWLLAATDGAPADLAWASFPCQDLSLAGGRAGLTGERSSAFYGFWRQVKALADHGAAPRTIVMENVPGLLTARSGQDFATLCAALADAGYQFGALQIDAAHFTPQSRPRVFLVATRDATPEGLTETAPLDGPLTPKSLIDAAWRLPKSVQDHWVWWRLPPLPQRNIQLADLLEDAPPASAWRSEDQTAQLLAQMAPLHQDRLRTAQAGETARVGAAFRRTRVERGERKVRAEVRFDGVAGCLRTPAGGSSKQVLVFCDPDGVRTRTLTPRETARLMGLPETYVLPEKTTAALHLTGDGVAVPAVRWLAGALLEPMLTAAPILTDAA